MYRGHTLYISICVKNDLISSSGSQVEAVLFPRAHLAIGISTVTAEEVEGEVYWHLVGRGPEMLLKSLHIKVQHSGFPKNPTFQNANGAQAELKLRITCD